MKQLLIAAAALMLAAPIAGCTSAAPTAAGATAAVDLASARLDRAERRYVAARAFLDLILPLAAPDRVEQLRAIEARIELALSRARLALTLADQAAALASAERGLAELDAPD